jgi:hypothetical protein
MIVKTIVDSFTGHISDINDAAIDATIVRSFGLQETKANACDGQREDLRITEVFLRSY